MQEKICSDEFSAFGFFLGIKTLFQQFSCFPAFLSDPCAVTPAAPA
jgi:hypothetical protein